MAARRESSGRRCSARRNEPEWRYLALFGALGLGGALFLAALVASRIADPLRKLTADAARFGSGELGARTDVRAPGEVGTSASTFNQMAATLADATRRHSPASEERHRLAARATNDVIWDWDISTSGVEWSEGASGAFRTPASELGRDIEWWSERSRTTVTRPRQASRTRSTPTRRSGRPSIASAAVTARTRRCWIAATSSGGRRGPRRMIGSMLNLTERRAAERERDRFFSLSADMFCIASFSGQFVRMNPAFCSGAGVRGRRADRNAGARSHPSRTTARRQWKARDRSRRALSRSVTRTTPVQGRQLQVARLDGPDPGREQGLVYAVARDITEQKRAEERLRRRKSGIGSCSTRTRLPMWVYDIETLAFVAVNDAAVKHYGYSRERIPRHAHHRHPAGRRGPESPRLRPRSRTRPSSTAACGSTERRTGGSSRWRWSRTP